MNFVVYLTYMFARIMNDYMIYVSSCHIMTISYSTILHNVITFRLECKEYNSLPPLVCCHEGRTPSEY